MENEEVRVDMTMDAIESLKNAFLGVGMSIEAWQSIARDAAVILGIAQKAVEDLSK